MLGAMVGTMREMGGWMVTKRTETLGQVWRMRMLGANAVTNDGDPDNSDNPREGEGNRISKKITKVRVKYVVLYIYRKKFVRLLIPDGTVKKLVEIRT